MQKARSEKLKTTLEEANALLGPSWDARDNIARTLISISSAAVALTLTFSNSIAALLGNVFWKYFVFIAWILFMLSILASILSLLTSRNAKTLLPGFMKQTIKLFTLSDSEKDQIDSIEQLTDDTVNKLLKFHKNNRWSERFLKVALICFGVAILLLGVVGGKQLIP
ncbi:MAG TPA: hypothetical protein VJ843_00325 [Candidatus Saccharimonadales bacterium]|nr:hypothetical protein [Candidatus Saccharimonadales bacterium]